MVKVIHLFFTYENVCLGRETSATNKRSNYIVLSMTFFSIPTLFGLAVNLVVEGGLYEAHDLSESCLA